MKIKGNKNEGLRVTRSAWLPKKEKAHDREAEGFDYLKGANFEGNGVRNYGHGKTAIRLPYNSVRIFLNGTIPRFCRQINKKHKNFHQSVVF